MFKGSDKLENCTAAQLLMRSGKIWLPDNAKWVDECEDEVFAWTGLPNEQDDIIDTLSDAAVEIGPLSDTLEKETADSIQPRFSLDSRNMIRNPGLKMGSPLAKLTQSKFSGKVAKTTINRQIN